jgi:hypothetical protein
LASAALLISTPHNQDKSIREEGHELTVEIGKRTEYLLFF